MIYTISSNNEKIEWGLVEEERVLQNVLNLVRTRKWEIPFMYDVGISQEFTDNKLSYIEAELTDEIMELVEKYEPRAKVVEVTLISVDENNNLNFDMKVEV